MEKGTTPKVSFSLSSSSSSSKPSSSLRRGGESEVIAGEGDSFNDAVDAKPQFITVFDPSPSNAASPATPVVIPPIPNSYHQNLDSNREPDSLILPVITTDAIISDAPEAIAVSDLPYGLTVRSSAVPRRPPTPTLEDGGMDIDAVHGDDEDPALRKFREDMRRLPEHRGMEEFREVSVTEYGAAVLRGYGWSEGQAVGRKKNLPDPQVVEFKPMTGTYGIGYIPAAAATGGDTKKENGIGSQQVVT